MKFRTRCPLGNRMNCKRQWDMKSTTICNVFFDVRIQMNCLNKTRMSIAIRPGPVYRGRSASRSRLWNREKPFPNAKTWAKVKWSSFGIKARFYAIQKICVIDHKSKLYVRYRILLRILQYSTTPYLFSLLLLFVGSEERSVSPSTPARDYVT